MLDFNCIVHIARIAITEDDNDIGGYKRGEDIGASVTFGRESDTGTGRDLPTGSSQQDHPTSGSRTRLLLLPASGGIERIGAFYCQAQKGGITERIPAIIMAANSKSSVVIQLYLWIY